MGLAAPPPGPTAPKGEQPSCRMRSWELPNLSYKAPTDHIAAPIDLHLHHRRLAQARHQLGVDRVEGLQRGQWEGDPFVANCPEPQRLLTVMDGGHRHLHLHNQREGGPGRVDILKCEPVGVHSCQARQVPRSRLSGPKHPHHPSPRRYQPPAQVPGAHPGSPEPGSPRLCR